MVRKFNRYKFTRKTALITLAVVLVVVGLGLWLRQPPKTATIPTIPATAAKQNTAANPNSSKAQTGSGATGGATKTTPAASTSTAPLISPYGSFVSNHHVTLGDSAVLEASTCNTNPGANCYIQFTKDGLTRNLAAQTTDASGVTSWTWDVKQAGLTQGRWLITAIASLGDQTKSTSDSLRLEIQ